ncbi:MAG: hypothetical protein IK124_01715 [Prevotella sp.]|nr:hypothetical protein [Prevotella sp.]MBR6946268.1 hypothetical protein [Prevotella sp.]
MNELSLSILGFSDRELFLVLIVVVTYATLFIVTVQNSKRKILQLNERLQKIDALREEQEAKSVQRIEQNQQRIAELEKIIHKLGDENSMLKLELEERKAKLDYNNKVARIEQEKRQQAESVIMGSDIYRKIKELLARGRSMSDDDWKAVTQMVNEVYTGFTERLFSLYRMSEQDYHVCLLIKIHIQPKDIATLTAHSKEGVASTRSRLYQKIFGKKGTTKDWDDFILSL